LYVLLNVLGFYKKTLAVVERERLCVRFAYGKSHPTMRLLVIDVSSVIPWGTRVNKETEKQLDRMKLPF